MSAGLDPSEMVAALVADAPSLVDAVREVIAPVQSERAAIRAYFEDKIRPVDTTGDPIPIGAADGAWVMNQTIVGDYLTTFALSLLVGLDGTTTIHDQHHWPGFVSHSSDNEAMAKAIMMAHEQIALAQLPDNALKIIDGSHVTPLVAMNLALASETPHVRANVLEVATEGGLADALAQNVADDYVIACPKSDSSLDLWGMIKSDLSLYGAPMPDKALASLILEPGEMLVDHRTPPQSWRYLYATQGKATDPRAKIMTNRITEAFEPLARGRIGVYHIKPEGSASVIRAELHPDLDFLSPDMLASLAASVAVPFVQEPLAQHLVDTLAKTISPLAALQLEEARLSLVDAGEEDLLPYLANHRTD